MSRVRIAYQLLIVAVMSFVGGFVATRWSPPVSTAYAQAQPGALKTKGLQIVDGAGKVRAEITVGKTGEAELSLMDQNGNKRVQLMAQNDIGSVALIDAAGTHRYMASQIESKDQVQAHYSDKDGNERLLTAVTKQGDTLVAFTGPKNEKWMTLMAGPQQASTLILADPKTKQNIVTFAGRGQASMQISDAQGKGGMLTSVLGDGRSVWALSKEGKLRMRGMCKEDGSPELVFMNKERQKTWTAGQK